MGTTATTTETIGRADKTLDALNLRTRGGSGRGGRGGGGPNGKGPGGGGGGGQDGWSPGRYRIGVFVGIASILMMFSALASAYIVRSGFGPAWQRTPVPSFLWVSTAVIVASSFTVAVALRALKRHDEAGFKRWLGVTLVLGLSFLSSQLLAWRQLVAQGFYLASNPHSSFFYVLTGLHGVHLLGGIVGLSYLIYFAWRKAMTGSDARGELKLRAFADVVAIYWHFMDGLWVFLFLLLFLWR